VSRQARVVFAIAALLSFFALAGSAAAEYKFAGAFAGAGTEPGQFETPGRAVVERSTGNLFVVDSGNDRVQVFEPNQVGTADYLTSFGGGELSEPWGIAIAEEGGQTSVYVADAGNERIVKYDSDEADPPTFTLDATFTSPVAGSGSGEVGSFKAALAIDPAGGDLLLADYANKLIQRFEDDGTFVSSFDGSNGGSAFEGPIDVAVNSGGDVYVIDANGPDIAEQEGTSRALRYSAAGAFKAELTPVGENQRPATVAVNLLTDEVAVSGEQDAVYRNGLPTLHLFDSSDQALPSPQLAASATYDTVSGLALGGGADGDHLYVVLDVGVWSGSPFGQVQVQAFRQPHPSAPAVLWQKAMPTKSEALLGATIDTGISPTQYRFEWGATSAYGSETATKNLPASEQLDHVSAGITGLKPGATYHFRIVVTNGVGTAEGEDQVFTTESEAGPDTCPNAAIRGIQGSAELPECRAFEMVSPVDKNGNDVTTFFPVQAAPHDERVAYASTGAFPGSQSSLSQSTYLSIRGANGWTTRPQSPPQTNTGDGGLIIGGVARAFSVDLSRGVSFSRLALAPGAAEGASNMYMQDTLTGELEFALGTPNPAFFRQAAETGGSVVYGGSDDYRHVVLAANAKLTDDAFEGPFIQNVYEFTDGEVRLVSILPNGEPSPLNNMVGKEGASSAEDRAVSADGQRIVFGEGSRLYQRVEGDHTIELSASEVGNDGLNPEARFGAASDDGTVVFFTARKQLTTAGEPDGEGFPPTRLYRYAEGHLTEIALTEGKFEDTLSVLSVSPQGDAAYYLLANRGAPTPEERQAVIYRWSQGQGVQEVTRLEAGEGGPGRWVDSSNGRFVAFQAASWLTPDAQPGPECRPDSGSLSEHCSEIYVYDSELETIECASCGPQPPRGDTGLGVTELSMSRQLARGIANDGTIYFDSPDRLTANDSDGKRDVYQWRDGAVTLLTPRTPTDVSYAGADKDGSMVYVVTTSRLVGQDVDSNNDLYAVRRLGGFAAQNPPPPPPPCQDETCQGATAPAPTGAAVGSLKFSGPGNVKSKSGSSGFRVSGATLIHGSLGKVRVTVPKAGRVTISGLGLERVQRRFRGAAQASLPVALAPKAIQRLRQRRRVQVQASVVYKPDKGNARSRRLALTFVSGMGR
jgi:hypothetical protein